MEDRLLTDGDIRYIERILYDQHSQDTAIAAMEAEIEEAMASMTEIKSTSYVDMSRSRGTGDDTCTQPESWAIQRTENLRVKYLQGKIAEKKRHREAVSRAMESMNENEARLVCLRYHNHKPHNYIAKQLDMWSYGDRDPTSSYWRTRKRVLVKVARYVGIL